MGTVVVVVATELVVEAGRVVVVAATVDEVAAGAVLVAAGAVVVVSLGTVVVVGTGTSTGGPSPVQTEVEVVEDGTVVVSRRVVEVLVSVCVTGTLGGFSVVGGAVVAGAEVVGADVVVDVPGVDVPGVEVPGVEVRLVGGWDDVVVELSATEVSVVEVRGRDVVVVGCVVGVVLDGTPACGLDGAPEVVEVVGCSSRASVDISRLCFAMRPSSTPISLASDAAVAAGETVVTGLLGRGPVWPDWITLVALLMSAAAAATLLCEEASSALLSHLFTEAIASSALWYFAGADGASARSRLAPAVTPTKSVMIAATRSLAWLLRRAARIARAVARTSAGPL